VEAFQPEGARSVALFKCRDQLNRAMSLPIRTADSLTIDLDPYLLPLEAILEEHHRVLIVELSRDAATFSVYQLGHEEKIDSLKSFVPDPSRDLSRPGKVQRHRLTHVHWHLKSAAQLAGRIVRERQCDLVALLGDHRVLAEFEEFLPKSLQGRILTRDTLSPHDDRGRRRAVIEAALDRHREREEEQALADLGRYRAEGQLAVGLEAVLDVANLFLMRALFVSDDLARAGFVCRDHHYLALDPGPCVFCQKDLWPTENVIDELVEFAWLHGVDVMTIRQRQELLRPFGGIAAVLLPVRPIEPSSEQPEPASPILKRS
jgi:peptide subunit release factor 1 (eRF1)